MGGGKSAFWFSVSFFDADGAAIMRLDLRTCYSLVSAVSIVQVLVVWV